VVAVGGMWGDVGAGIAFAIVGANGVAREIWKVVSYCAYKARRLPAYQFIWIYATYILSYQIVILMILPSW